jgi:hypothetical protein
LFKLGPVDLRGVPVGVRWMNMGLWRRGLLTTHPVKNNLLGILNICTPTVGPIVLLVNLYIHAQNMLLKPVKLLYLLLVVWEEA